MHGRRAPRSLVGNQFTGASESHARSPRIPSKRPVVSFSEFFSLSDRPGPARTRPAADADWPPLAAEGVVSRGQQVHRCMQSGPAPPP